MKKIFMPIVTAILVACLAACSNSDSSDRQSSGSSNPSVQTSSDSAAQSNDAAKSENNEVVGSNDPNGNSSGVVESGSNILIAYFTAAENSGVDAIASASVTVINGESYGVSQAIANMIAAETGGDLFSIQTSVVYPANMGELIDYAAGEQNDGVMPELTTHIDNLDDYDTVFIGFPIWWYDMPQVMYSFFEEYDFSGKTIIPFTVHNGSRLSGTPAAIQELEPNAVVIMDGFTVSHSNAADATNDVAVWLQGLGY